MKKSKSSKKKSSLPEKTASSEQIYFVGRNGIKVYPVSELGSWFIEINNNGRVHRFQKKLPQNELNSAIASTIIYYYNKLKETK